MSGFELAYGVCAGPEDRFERIALPGIRAVGPGAPILVRRHQTSIHEAYNSLIDEARSRSYGGLILLHDDVQIRDLGLPDKVRSAFTDPAVGVVGAVGARATHSIEWWQYDAHGYVDQLGQPADFGRGDYEVDTVDGVFMALSRPAMEAVRLLPAEYPGFHGYDAELCSQVQAAGLRIRVIDTDILHAKPPLSLSEPDEHEWADRTWRRRWRAGMAHQVAYRSRVLLDSQRTPTRRLRRLVSR